MSSRVQELRLPRGKSPKARESAAAAPFISGRIADNFWIILAPVVALLVMELFWRFSGLSDLAIFSVLFALIVTGHHMPGWIRAFGEPAVYERHKARLWVSLFAIPALVIVPTIFGLGTVALTVAASFDLWHVSMQQHGFGRIYSAKAGFYRAVFGTRRGMLAFLGLIALYGTGAYLLSSSGYRLLGADAERGAQVIGSIGLASLLLHFYVDSFIWKVRSKEVRAALAIREDSAAAAAPAAAEAPREVKHPQLRGAAHALAYFGLPVVLIALAGARGRHVSPQAEQRGVAQEARLFPRSAFAHYNFGRAALQAGDASTARAELAKAVDLAPTFAGPAKLLAELDRREGRIAEEIGHAFEAVRAEPSDANLRYQLGNVLAGEKRLEEAEMQYREVIRLRPNFAGGHQNLGVLYKWSGRLKEAVPFFRKAYALDPDLSAAACDLAGALATLGETGEALAVIQRYRERHPEDAVAADLERAIRADAAR